PPNGGIPPDHVVYSIAPDDVVTAVRAVAPDDVVVVEIAPHDVVFVEVAPDDVVHVEGIAPDDVVAVHHADDVVAPDDVVGPEHRIGPDDVVRVDLRVVAPDEVPAAPHDGRRPGRRVVQQHVAPHDVVAPDDVARPGIGDRADDRLRRDRIAQPPVVG